MLRKFTTHCFIHPSKMLSQLFKCLLFFNLKAIFKTGLFCCLLLAAFSEGFASDTIFTHIYRDGIDERVNLSSALEILVDKKGTYTVEDILHRTDLELDTFDNKQIYHTPYVVWARLRVSNESSTTRQDYFRLNSYADTVLVYTIENGKVIETQKNGAAFKPQKKSLLTFHNYVPFSIASGESREYCFKLNFISEFSIKGTGLRVFYILPGKKAILQRIKSYAIVFFYTGIMLLFGLVSLFMFNMFRERVFIYFAMLMFSCPLYFLKKRQIIAVLLNFASQTSDFLTQCLIVSGIILSSSLFISRYLRLPQQLPRYFKWYAGYFVFAAFFPFLLKLAGGDIFNIFYISNSITLIWIILTILPVFLLRQKDKSARVLLWSTGILFLSSLVLVFEMVRRQVLGQSDTIPLAQYSVQIGTVIFSSILFYDLFNKISTIKAEKQKFQELDTLKSRFFANISHEFRTPLTLVMGPVQQVLEKQTDPNNKSLLQMAHRNASRLLQLINQLLDLSKLDSNKMALKAKEHNFPALLKGIVMSFESLATRKNIRLHFVSQHENIPLYVDKDKMEKIFYNLLSNAFKFTPEQGEISVMVTAHKKYVEILVRDTGIGIPIARLEHIFNRFYQVDSSETREQEGTGIGLALVKELIALHKGTIRVKSKKGKGTTFSVHLRRGKDHFDGNDLVENGVLTEDTIHQKLIPEELVPIPLLSNAKRQPTASPTQKDLPTVLIIDDNEDVRAYIKQHLVATFQVLEAINGQDGIEQALEHLPDLVISDVMMPKKNGYEVCGTLKTDQKTSHIPVILLTAKAAQEEKLRGLEIGADDYLVKPFDTKELEIRVQNLISLRQRLRQQFSAAPTIEPQAVQTNAVDKAFLEKVCATIESNLSNEQFSVEVLAKTVGMSRVHLNRKLKALTDQSANKFIQSLRLQRAMEALQQKKGNVSEIAFEVGFSSTSYFVKCFKDKYGKTPGKVLEEG